MEAPGLGPGFLLSPLCIRPLTLTFLLLSRHSPAFTCLWTSDLETYPLKGPPHGRHISPFMAKQDCGSPSPLLPMGLSSHLRARHQNPLKAHRHLSTFLSFPPQTQATSTPCQPHLQSAGAAGVQQLGEKVRRFLKNYTELPYDPAIPLLGLCTFTAALFTAHSASVTLN